MAAEFESPLQPVDGEPSSPAGGRNTLISHGGKWHNLEASLGHLRGDGHVGAWENSNTRRYPLQNQKNVDTQSQLPEGSQIRATKGTQEQTNRRSGSNHHVHKDFNACAPDLYSTHQESDRAWDGSRERVSEQEEQLTPRKILELASSPLSIPLSELSADLDRRDLQEYQYSPSGRDRAATSATRANLVDSDRVAKERGRAATSADTPPDRFWSGTSESTGYSSHHASHDPRLHPSTRTVSTPVIRKRLSATAGSGLRKDYNVSTGKARRVTPNPLRFEEVKAGDHLSSEEDPKPSPMPRKIPMPPLSLPTYLQLELSSHRPASTYIHRSATSDFPYETSRVKLERLQNFFSLPPQLERVLGFGALACLDAWLYSFTILPLRFLKALGVLSESLGRNVLAEMQFIGSFIYIGVGRMWRRKRRMSNSTIREKDAPKAPQSDEDTDKAYQPGPVPGLTGVTPETKNDRLHSSVHRHRRSKSKPSSLLPDHKADLLKGLLIILTCIVMMHFDPSRMYHGIRGQAAIKLYVIYNVLEVCDRLFAALGQDVLECLFSKETLERRSDGRSKVLRPFWLFGLAFTYNLVHATALFYQVITLNVAVNSYSNALLTLLMSNQFVEIKSTVFKKFEKENLFQITCADVVERFQLWLMLTIIACRNIVETGSLMPSSSSNDDFSAAFLPKAFTLEVVPFLSGQVIGPYLIVLGSEMLVDWLKHAYITKFNMTKPTIYGRFLDILCKDYYSNAFATQNLTRRIGLPVLPLACLFIRASIQTYHMFLATHMPSPLPPSSASTTVAVPAPTALLPEALSSFLNHFLPDTPTHMPFTTVTPDTLLTLLTTALAFLLIYLVLLCVKLLLGVALLHFARNRYRGMKELEEQSFHAEGKRVGGWGVVEVDEDKKRWIYADDPVGLRRSKERENQARKPAAADGARDLMNVDRYSMVAKRIW